MRFVHVGQARKQQLDGRKQQRVAMHALGVIRVELLIDRGRRGGRAGDSDSTRDRPTLLRWQTVEEDRAGVVR